MKTFKKYLNRAGLFFFGGVALIMVLSVVGDFFPTYGAKTYDYSDETLEAEKIYTSIASDLTEAQKTLELAKLTYEQAMNAEKSIQVTLCAQQLTLAQLKYGDTDPNNTKELDRLTISITNAQACLVQGLTKPVGF